MIRIRWRKLIRKNTIVRSIPNTPELMQIPMYIAVTIQLSTEQHRTAYDHSKIFKENLKVKLMAKKNTENYCLTDDH